MRAMKLRVILLVLCILVLVSTSVGGYMYYSSLKEASVLQAKNEADSRARNLMNQLSSHLAANLKPVQAMAGLDEMHDALARPDARTLHAVNVILDQFQSALAVDVCYLMALDGTTIASSNRYAPDSFVGQNFSYRPYYSQATEGFSATYMALGTTSGIRGAYYSHPVFAKGTGTPLGVAVIKTSIGQMEDEFLHAFPGMAALVSPEGIIFGSSRKDWLFKTLHELTPAMRKATAGTRQFGSGPWEWTGLSLDEDAGLATDTGGREYLASSMELDYYQGWKVLYLRDIADIPTSVTYASFKATGTVVVALCILTGLAVLALYRLANNDIVLRKKAEAALVESTDRYRSLYHNTPAMLHSIDADSRLLSVSDYWCETMGYAREEVIGRSIIELHTDKSRRFAKEEAIPAFFKNGLMRDVPYQFATKDGRVIDVLTTATAERGPEGEIQRSLAVSVDITARIKAEGELLQAQEKLARYSEDLERQVDERTRETAAVLDKLKRVSGSVLEGQEQERAAIARRLHDELGQVLTALRMDAVWIKDRLTGTDHRLMERAKAMCDLVDATISDVRNLATRLRPAVLDDLGLLDALEWLTTEFEKRTRITCVLTHRAVDQLPGAVATATYRVAQEALTNVARHARATKVKVSLKQTHASLELSVSDNGKGFDPAVLVPGRTLGLAGMQERAGLAGGVLDILAGTPGGTTIRLRLPLEGDTQHSMEAQS